MARREKLARRFAIATAIGMFIVLLMGARVTATGSAEGCGNDWPLCHGSWLPADTYESLTEYSHRFVTGIEGILVAITTVLCWPLRRKYPSFNLFVPLMAGTLVLQSLMGAAAVRWPQSAEVMATHFGISLVCLASAALLARVITQSEHASGKIIRNPVSSAFTWYTIALIGVSIVTAYAGAYVRHTDSELACTTWPTCTGELWGDLSEPMVNQYLHRIAAVVISLMIAGLLLWTMRIQKSRPDLFIAAWIASGVVIAQAMVGKVVIDSGLALMATLSHAGLMAILFVVLCDIARVSWFTSRGARLQKTSVLQPTGVR